jgi:hypothetical protein
MDILPFSTSTVYKYLWIHFPTLNLYLQRLRSVPTCLVTHLCYTHTLSSMCLYTLIGMYHNNSLYLRRLSTCLYTLTVV